MKRSTIRRTQILVCNTDARKIQAVVCNLLPANCRVDQLENRDYVVVPMVILTEGVHAGSLGPLYYPKDELSKTPVVWNHKPIVVYHPTMNGESISACDPVVINSRKIGLMMNTKFEGGRLKSEAWIERTRADAVDDRIMKAVDAKEMMELSTGVFVDTEEKEGDWNGEAYTHIARNYRPDHLALLPDQIGACSIADGAGLLRNTGKTKSPLLAGLGRILQKMGMADNAMSFSNIESALRTALMDKFPTNVTDGPWVWIANVYPSFVIYERDGKLWRQGYTSNETEVTLSTDAPVEVVRVTEYRTVDGAFVGNQNQEPSTEEHIMNKKKVIGILMANAVTVLNGVTLTANLTDDQLKAINEEQLEAALNGVIEAKAKAAAPPVAPVIPPAANIAPVVPPVVVPPANVTNIQDYLKTVPAEFREVVTNGMTSYAEEKTKLVGLIMNAKGNEFVKEDLMARSNGELKMLAKLANAAVVQTRAPSYFGQAPVENEAGDQVEEAMEVPVLNFSKS